MRTKACIIITWFGDLPRTIAAFMQSCKNNPEFQWLIFTDCSYEQLPSNVKFVSYNMREMRELIEKKLNMKVSMERPYKMCDFRPAYGVIFEDYLKGYDFWGYGDLDVIYGNLSNFITDEIFNDYDKIYTCGHLSFVRNNDECNHIYKLHTQNSIDYMDVFTNDISFIFDEYRGMNEKLLKKGFKIYDEFQFADIDVVYKRFRMVDRKTINLCFPRYPFKGKFPHNYNYQLFIWENGSAYHIYIDKKGKVNIRELVYIHYRKKIPCTINDFTKGSFLVCDEGIIKYSAFDRNLIIRYNDFPGKVFEINEYRAALKNAIITQLGKSMWLVKMVRFIKGKNYKEKTNE